MDAHKLQVKIYAADAAAFHLEPFVPVFQSWIRNAALGELLLDVVDYGHVHHGPGVLLVGHASDYSADLGEGRPGLVCSRKREAPEPRERLRDALRRTLHACALLEREPAFEGNLKFRTDEILLRIMDRLRAPNSAAVHRALRTELSEFVGTLFDGVICELTPEGDEKQPFAVRIRAKSAPSLSALLERVA